MILLAGGTGMLGSMVANRLVRDGREVRVLSRGLTHTGHRLDPQVQPVLGDVREAADVDRAMTDVQVVVSAIQGFSGPGNVSPDSVDRLGNEVLVAAAERAGAAVVLVSVAPAAADSPMELARAKYTAEERTKASTCPWTILRPDAFAQVWLGLLAGTAGRRHRPLVFGDADNPIGWVDVEEVAALVVRAVTDEHLRDRTLALTGPERVTLLELARLLMEVRGWAGRPRRVPRSVLHVAAHTVGVLRPSVGRMVRAALAMDELAPVDDGHTRALLPDLPATPVSEVARRPVHGAL